MDETDPLAKQTETREDGLDNDLAAHINSKMADLALSSVEKQVKTRVGCSDLFALIQEVHIKLCSHCFLPQTVYLLFPEFCLNRHFTTIYS